MNSYMDDQIPLIIAVGRYSGEVRKGLQAEEKREHDNKDI